MIPSIRRILAVAAALLSVSTALQVAPGSPCASACLDRADADAFDPNASSTTVSDIVCDDQDFTSTVKGLKFKECTECLQSSRHVSGSEADLYWYLYNLRYAANVCIFNYPAAVQNKSFACQIPQNCGALSGALRVGDLAPDNSTQLAYCNADGKKMSAGWARTGCHQCLATVPDMWFLSNFMVALDAACQQNLKAGDLIGLSASLFNRFAVNATDPPQLETGPPPPSGTSMSMGTIIGIAIGAALLLLGGVALFVVYWRKQRRIKAEDARRAGNNDTPNGGGSVAALAANGGGPGSGGGGFLGADLAAHGSSIRGGYTMDHKREYSLTSLNPYDPNGGDSGRYTSNSDYYDQYEKQQQVAQKFGVYPAGGALPAHPAYIPRSAITSIQSQRPNSTDSRGSRNTSTSQQQQQQPQHPSPLQQQLQLQHQHPSRAAAAAAAVQPRSTPPRGTPEPMVLAAPPPGKPRSTKSSSSTTTPAVPVSGPTPGEAYALQQYLAGSDDRPAAGLNLPPPPAGPPPRASTSSASSSHREQRTIDPNNMPPPPPPQAKIPSLVLPSVPRIRVPKKYSPPQISLQEATPVDDEPSVITGPLDHNFQHRRQMRQQQGVPEPQSQSPPPRTTRSSPRAGYEPNY
ncbi:hypothetical protein RB594_008260 [Gaeumannomyces avenae]